MGFFGFIGNLARNSTVHVFQDLFTPGRRTAKRIQQDIDRGITIPVDFEKDNFIAFSDIHRGNGDKNDRFKNASIYSGALEYYKDNSTLVLLGDIEECWGYKKKIDALIEHNQSLFTQEKEFIKNGKYIRIIGNHDDLWIKPQKVDTYLNTNDGTPKIEPHTAVILQQGDNKLLLIHGCQGNNFSDIGDQCASDVISFKFSTGFVKSSLKEFEKKQRKLQKQELRILKWAKGQNMIVVFGHTHTPYFLSTPSTRFEERLLRHFDESLKRGPARFEKKQMVKSRKSVEKIMKSTERHHKKIKKLEKKISGTVFNTGNCCKDLDEISGIEISNGVIKEVYWKEGATRPEVPRNREMKLSEIFELIHSKK